MPVFYSEIEPFPSAVIKQRHPDAPNIGDVSQIDGNKYKDDIDVLIGGSPCQDLSVAGKREGFDGKRSHLFFEMSRIANESDPAIVIWENVPGALSSNNGEDFAAVLGELVEGAHPTVPDGGWTNTGMVFGPKGTSAAWRILNAQFFGVAQRRRRVFVIVDRRGHRAGEILFEPKSLSGDSEASRETGQIASALTSKGVGTCGADDNQAQANHLIAGTLTPMDRGITPEQAAANHVVVKPRASWWDGSQTSQTLDAVLHKGQTMPEKNRFPAVLVPDTSPPLTTKPFADNEAQEGKLVVFDAKASAGFAPKPNSKISPTLRSMSGKKDNGGGQVAIAFSQNQRGKVRTDSKTGPVNCRGGIPGQGYPAVALPIHDKATRHTGVNARGTAGAAHGLGIGKDGDPANTLTGGDRHAVFALQHAAIGRKDKDGPKGKGYRQDIAYTQDNQADVDAIATDMIVRRLTPRECERLQGFNDDYTLIEWPTGRDTHIEQIIPYIMDAGFTKEEATKLAKTPDGPRYKALGNSFAVPVIRYLGQRIDFVLNGIL